MPVEIAPRQIAFASDLCRDLYHGERGWLSRDQGDRYPDLVAAYRRRLEGAGLTGERTVDFMEAVYPIDASRENLDAFLARPQAALAALRPILECSGTLESLVLVILADNSD